MPRSRVLIVDDFADGLESLRLIIEGWGYDVEVALTGEEGFALFTARRPHVVIIGLALPDIDGCDVIRRMRAFASGTFIIAHSGFQTYVRKGPARAAGADAFILKRDLDGLEDALRAHDVAQATAKGSPRPGSRPPPRMNARA